jgi:DNA repair protein RadC
MKVTKLKHTLLPREKLNKYGANKLHNYELIAILLGSGVKGCNVLELAKRVDKCLVKTKPSDVTINELSKIKGLGNTKATMLVAIIEYASRMAKGSDCLVFTPQDAWKMCTDFKNSKKEHVVAFYLDTQKNFVERRIISIGTLDKSILHPREVFEPAIELSAAGIVLVHNHPSGSLLPSQADINITDRMTKAGELIGIAIIDHIIITAKGYYSINGN